MAVRRSDAGSLKLIGWLFETKHGRRCMTGLREAEDVIDNPSAQAQILGVNCTTVNYGPYSHVLNAGRLPGSEARELMHAAAYAWERTRSTPQVGTAHERYLAAVSKLDRLTGLSTGAAGGHQ